MKKVIVAMSGGVDSSVTAYLLKESGYDVIGITFQILNTSNCSDIYRYEGCCGVSTIKDAKKTAKMLNIPHYVVNTHKDFKKNVIDYFIKEYSKAKTPNPCIRCNQKVRFPILEQYRKKLRANFTATGHYAIIENNMIKKGIDSSKDQSYVLCAISKKYLARLIMPLGYYTKKEVRKIARKVKLPAADKEESQEICFIPAGTHYSSFLEEYGITTKKGNVVDKNGNVIGTHKGLIHYTIGQRKWLGISRKNPLYVISLNKKTNTVVAGENKDVFFQKCIVKKINWFSNNNKELYTDVKIRSNSHPTSAKVKTHNNYAEVLFFSPQRAVSPGQYAVFYNKGNLLGGGVIEKAL